MKLNTKIAICIVLSMCIALQLSHAQQPSTYTDSRDNHIYKTINIGSQTWMAENLAYMSTISPANKPSASSSCYYVYGYNNYPPRYSDAKKTENYGKYGALYNHAAAMKSCPAGWHLPSVEEWKILTRHIDSLEKVSTIQSTEQLALLKAIGFNPLKAGSYKFSKKAYHFNGLDNQASWWTSSVSDSDPQMYSIMKIESWNSNFYELTADKKEGLSVRCIKNNEAYDMLHSMSPNERMEYQKNKILQEAGFEFVKINKGSFIMGDNRKHESYSNDENEHEVTLTYNFEMAKYETTQDQYSYSISDHSHYDRTKANYPVTEISWREVTHFCNELSRKAGLPLSYNNKGKLLNAKGEVTNDISKVKGYRMPTEAEWEYAAKAGTNTRFAFGEYLSSNDANFNGEYPLPGCEAAEFRDSLMPVASFKPNAWGLYDMHGNVWEYCTDLYDSSGPMPEDLYKEPQTNPYSTQYNKFCIVRGGCWYSSMLNCRSSNRFWEWPKYGNKSIGFRIVRTLD